MDMEMKQFMEAMELKELPEIFLEQWETAMKLAAEDEIWFLNDSYLEEVNQVLFISEEKLSFFRRAMDMIRPDANLVRFVCLWHCSLFVHTPFPPFDEVLEWPFPEKQMGDLGQMFHGVALLSGLRWLSDFYRSRNIPQKILVDTLSEFDICLNEHKAKYGEYGIGVFRTMWLLYHFSGRLFRLGRLEYVHNIVGQDFTVYQNKKDGRIVTIYEEPDPNHPEMITGRQLMFSGRVEGGLISLPTDEWKSVLKKGDPELQIHITINERMPIEPCRKSLAIANDFFTAHFPDQLYQLLTCYSWLLEPQLAGLLPGSSNIVRFQKFFQLFSFPFEESDVYRFGFDVYEKPEDLSTLPVRSSMHRILKAHLMEGKHILSMGGFILKEDCPTEKDFENYEELYLRCCGMKGPMTSGERVVAAIKRRHVDYVPCAPFYDELCPEPGLDPVVTIETAGYKEVWGAKSPVSPVAPGNELECLKQVLTPAALKDCKDRFCSDFAGAKAIAEKYGLATVCNIGSGLAGAMGLLGHDRLNAAVMEEPELVDSYLEMEHQLNLHFIDIATELGIDIILRNGFYETCDFFNLETIERFVGKRLEKEIDRAHKGGKVIVYAVNAGIMPMMDYLAKLDFDCIAQIDTSRKDVDLKEIKNRLGDRKSFWLGPDPTSHMAEGSVANVKKAVADVFNIFGKQGILIAGGLCTAGAAPRENIRAMVEEWRKLRIYP